LIDLVLVWRSPHCPHYPSSLKTFCTTDRRKNTQPEKTRDRSELVFRRYNQTSTLRPKKNRDPVLTVSLHDVKSRRERVESDSRGENKNIYQRDLHVLTKSLENEK
jgi:hypothetical protein